MVIKKTILLIEDNFLLLENISEILELENYEVISAENGSKAISILENNIPDIVICDVLMPGINGYEVLKKIRSNPITADTPFIFFTAKSEKVDIDEGLEMGADAFLIKPFEVDDLLRLIDTCLKKSLEV